MSDTWKWEEAKSNEYMDWEDTGCEISTSCLECPLPLCKHDDPAWFTKYKKAAQHRIIFYLLSISSSSKDIKRLAKHYQCTERTIFRIKSKWKNQDLEQKYIDLFADCINATDSVTK